MAGICPHCDAPITEAHCYQISVRAPGAIWTGVSYCCPSCEKVLSVGIDPVALKTDTLDELEDRLRKILRKG